MESRPIQSSGNSARPPLSNEYQTLAPSPREHVSRPSPDFPITSTHRRLPTSTSSNAPYRRHPTSPTSSNIVQHRPTLSSNIVQHRPTSSNIVQHRRPTSSNIVQHRRPTSSNIVQHRRPTSSNIARHRPISSDVIQHCPTPIANSAKADQICWLSMTTSRLIPTPTLHMYSVLVWAEGFITSRSEASRSSRTWCTSRSPWAMFDPAPPNYHTAVVSSRWLHAAMRLPVHLTLPEKFSPPMPLPDPPLLPPIVLHNKRLETVYDGNGQRAEHYRDVE
ncbi:hypothetical protein CONPUDRAFT_150806 [Coniophora puteana RWD-64-598 SS2]|uniref:Uncharacterized protein n=1 Tax=Coniophora puteana (strain RWD-64-598) TaxID=741705 RepID=A0A5M3MYM5_CONPW|nr:uncharacterized protein CONPUDRAFT_150806 [Coniophora puteana RWD-64-598 SS2]EIW83745.1 hypothetical protein CONPUDRAFT_150806 [Coniophora puteana RWD-64-598 SS2]